MKNLLLVIVAVIALAISGFGQSPPQTPNIGLYNPPQGYVGWAPFYILNWNLLDSLLSANATVPGLSISGSGLTINSGTLLSTTNATGTGNLVKATGPTITGGTLTSPTITTPTLTTPTATNAILDGTIANGTAIQTSNANSCATAASNQAQCTFTWNWPATFSSSNYYAVCNFDGGTVFGPLVSNISSKTTTSMSITIQTSTGGAASGHLSCVGIVHP